MPLNELDRLAKMLESKLRAVDIPAKEIKCYGSQIMITCRGEESAKRFASLLGDFCTKVRGPVESIDRNKENTKSTLIPSVHKVWRVSATV